MNMGSPDPCLWLIHYSKAQMRDQHPASSLPVPAHVAQSFQQRTAIQRSGQIPRKEFMLHDRTSWPIISLPAGLGRVGSSGQMVASHRRSGSLQEHQATLEEEEDVSRGDVLDFMTPREISRMRYEQHHEWMEEILESHYASKQIIPSDLGLGRKGALESFTNGFFTAPVSVDHEPINGKVGKLPPGKADEFTKHAEQKLAEMQAELDKMRQDHVRRMERLRRTTVLGAAERKLRNMSVNAADNSHEAIASQVQDLVGRKIDLVQHLKLVSKGGLQDINPIAPASQDMFQLGQGNKAQYPAQTAPNQNSQSQQQPYQQQRTEQIPSQQQSQQSRQPQVYNQVSSAQAQQPASIQQKPAPGPNEPNVPGQMPSIPPTGQPRESVQAQVATDTSNTPIENNDAVSTGNDLDMDDQELDTGDDNNDVGDWDMLMDQAGDNEQGVEDRQNNDQRSGIQRTASQSNQNTPGGDVNEFDMVTDFDTNMDTAGDALADYGGGDDDLNLEESAFGDAFHSHEQDMA